MALKGMDVDQVRQLAQSLHQASSTLITMISTLSQQVRHASWIGPDREGFVAGWNSHHATALKNVATALQDASTRANLDAQQQDDASNA